MNSFLINSAPRQDASAEYYLPSIIVPNNVSFPFCICTALCFSVLICPKQVHEPVQNTLERYSSKVSDGPMDLGGYDYDQNRNDQYFDAGTSQVTRQPVSHFLLYN